MNESLLFSLSAFGIALFVPAALCVFSLRYPPTWVTEGALSLKWGPLNVLALSLSVSLMILAGFIYSSFAIEYVFIAVLSTGVMSFVAVQTFATDFVLRKADRRLLRMANFVSAVAGLWFLSNYTDHTTVLVYVLLFLCFSLLMFVPQLGQSDTRALQLVILSSIPVIGIGGFQAGMILVAIFVVIYGLIKSRKSLSSLLTKISTPLVPLIIAPYVLMVVLFPLI